MNRSAQRQRRDSVAGLVVRGGFIDCGLFHNFQCSVTRLARLLGMVDVSAQPGSLKDSKAWHQRKDAEPWSELMRPFGLLVLLVIVVGCSGGSTRDRFARVQPGQTREQVRALLGDAVGGGVLNALIEQWEYTDDNTLYLVRFGPMEKMQRNPSTWRVTNRESHPKESFVARFNRIYPGMTRDEIEKILGEPKSRRQTRYSVTMRGPGEGLSDLLKEGTAYEEWHYQDDTTDFWVFVGPKGDEAAPEWRVLSRESYPQGVAF